MARRFLKRVGRVFGRDVVLVHDEAGYRQAFCRASGRSAELPGVWLPFDGVQLRVGRGPWFDTSRFRGLPELDPLYRLATPEHRDVSRMLGGLAIPVLPVVPPSEVNELLTYAGHEPFVIRLCGGIEKVNERLDAAARGPWSSRALAA